MKTRILSFFLLFVPFGIYGQNRVIKLKGEVKDSIGMVIDANIINLRSKDGTFSNDLGQFKIKAKEGDTIQVSSIQHFTKKYVIKSIDIVNQMISIYLIMNRYELEEVVLPETNLTKRLAVDAKIRQQKRSEKKKNELGKMLEEASRATFIQPIGVQPSDRGLAGVSAKQVDPTKGFRGIGFGFGLGKRKDKAKKKLKKMDQNDQFYNGIIKRVSFDFFDTIDIPKNLITHFLKHFGKSKLQTFSKEENTLDLMLYLKNESKIYNLKRKSLTKD